MADNDSKGRKIRDVTTDGNITLHVLNDGQGLIHVRSIDTIFFFSTLTNAETAIALYERLDQPRKSPSPLELRLREYVVTPEVTQLLGLAAGEAETLHRAGLCFLCKRERASCVFRRQPGVLSEIQVPVIVPCCTPCREARVSEVTVNK